MVLIELLWFVNIVIHIRYTYNIYSKLLAKRRFNCNELGCNDVSLLNIRQKSKQIFHNIK